MTTKSKTQQDQADHASSSFAVQIIDEMVPLMQQSQELGKDLAEKLKKLLPEAGPEDILRTLKQ